MDRRGTTAALDLTRTRRAFATMLAILACASVLATPGNAERAAATIRVIVQGTGPMEETRTAVESVGGTVRRPLGIVHGVAATIPPDAKSTLENSPAVFQVTPDAAVAFEGDDYTLAPNRVPANVGSDRLWNEGVTGSGVTVALIDTGVHAAHPDLAGRVVACKDLSHERGTEAECADTFGHGTFMAGLIAGSGASSGGAYKGAAPGANIVSVKVAGFDGATDVSHVLAGVQWVVAHKNQYGIRALNLSLGSDSSQDYRLSPLNYAVERAWNAGITVVVSAGNSGPDSRTILKPADDPYVITVGASNDEGTTSTSDDRVPVFSSRGPTRSNGLAKPDVVAPGTHTISLRSPGSAIDQQFGTTATVQDHYFRGTGTSMSAALTTGVVAQILQASPGLNPNQVKHRLMSTAKPIAERSSSAAGRGLVDAYAATRSTSTKEANRSGLLNTLPPASTGLGTLQGSRGSLAVDVQALNGQIPLTGEFVAQVDSLLGTVTGLLPWNGLTYSLVGWDGVSWRTTSWELNDWAGVSWRGVSWRNTEWDGVSWRGVSWRNTDWEGVSWRGSDWNGVSWRASNWQTAWYAAAWQ